MRERWESDGKKVKKFTVWVREPGLKLLFYTTVSQEMKLIKILMYERNNEFKYKIVIQY